MRTRRPTQDQLVALARKALVAAWQHGRCGQINLRSRAEDRRAAKELLEGIRAAVKERRRRT